jgi:hypothetical protein
MSVPRISMCQSDRRTPSVRCSWIASVNGSSPAAARRGPDAQPLVRPRLEQLGEHPALEHLELRLVAEEARLVDRDPVEHLLELVGLVRPDRQERDVLIEVVELELLQAVAQRLSRMYFFVSWKWIPLGRR